MKLTLDRLDLLEQHAEINCSRTQFEHFSQEAQVAILAVGRAVFYEYDKSSYNAIYAPKDEPSQGIIGKVDCRGADFKGVKGVTIAGVVVKR